MSKIINNILSNDLVEIPLTMMLALFVGNSLNPVPKIFEYFLFDSFLFKFIILALFGIRMFHPLDNKRLLKIIIIAFIISIIIEYFRRKNEIFLYYNEKQQ